MKVYTEVELLKAIEWACSYQKACDYQVAGRYLLIENEANLPGNIEMLLNDLCDTDINAHNEIKLSDIFN